MDLFAAADMQTRNLLPIDGEAYYFGQIISPEEADHYYEILQKSIDWRHDEAFIFGRTITTRRKVAWYADEAFSYRYSGKTKTALLWTKELSDLKKQIEKTCGETFNSCLLNLYHDGSEGMSWHSDGEKELKRHGAIASLSLGARRKFSFRHRKSGEKLSLMLDHGSLLLMTGTIQDHWQHALPVTKKVREGRINLTFRTINGMRT